MLLELYRNEYMLISPDKWRAYNEIWLEFLEKLLTTLDTERSKKAIEAIKKDISWHKRNLERIE